MTLSRRQFLAGLGGAALLAACSDDDGGDAGATTTDDTATSTTTTTAAPAPDVALASDPFTLGVASGDPDATSVVLWTRLLPDAAPIDAAEVPVRWDVLDADDAVVATGEATAEARWGHSVHAVAEGLDAGTEYRYVFRVGEFTSPTGTTRTAPEDDGPVSLAVASCQRYDDGFYAAHRDIAAADVDLVVFLGDYVYESRQRDTPVRPLPGTPELVADLAGYRSRYEAGRRDPDLAAAHAAHPWAVTWDDHEVANNHSGPAVAPEQRQQAYQAWWEHMPVRVPPPADGALSVHRSLRWGPALELLLLDTRQYRAAAPCGNPSIVDNATCADVADPTRTFLGEEQEAWLVDRLAAADATWTVLGQSVVMANITVGGQVNGDAWDGYAPARERVAAAMAGVADAVVLTGDIHVQLMADIATDAGEVVAAELVAPSVSSRASEALTPFIEALPSLSPNVKHADGRFRGWLRCDFDAERCLATYREVADVADAASDVVDGPAFEVRRGTPGVSAQG